MDDGQAHARARFDALGGHVVFFSQAIETRLFARIRPIAVLRTLYANWRKRRRLRDLQHLTDHMRDDIGLTRADLAATLGQPITVDPIWDLERRAMRRRNQSMPKATTRFLNDRAFAHPKLPQRD